ncbi:MAG: hypothetical protein ACI9UN_003445 [Granulosicoccus sp.]|jgi:hypothetical protein
MAAFERSFYMKTTGGIFCVGVPEIGCGPLNALLGSEQHCLPFKVTVGKYVRISNQKILLDDGQVIDANQASIYHGDVSFTTLAPQILERNRNTLKTLRGMPEDGFFWLLGNHTSCKNESAVQSALRKTTSPSLNGLLDYLYTGFAHSRRDSDNHDASAAVGLLGAGPGLTPAGDDAIAGVMLALLRFQRADLVKAIWKAIESSLPVLTNEISAAHLEQAAEGFCSESMNEVLDQIFQAEEIEAATLVTALNGMGCTSGWDTLGGVAMVIDAWQYSLNTTHRTVITC